MRFTTKLFNKATAAAVCATLLFSAAPASAQINSVSDLLNKVRNDASKTEAENRDREAKFRQRRDQQAGLLNEANAELNQLERRAAQVESSFAANRNEITRLEDQLKTAQGNFGEVFGLAKSKAGEFKALLDNSLITSENPNRTQILGRVAESKALPSTDDLDAIWKTMLSEIQMQRQVSTYDAPVANIDDGAEQKVTRVGPFAVFTADNAEFLGYSAPSAGSESTILLSKLPRQPGGLISSAAQKVVNAGDNTVVFAPLDPTRGELLKSFERVPTMGERLKQGELVGFIIFYGFFCAGILFGLILIVRLFLMRMAVSGQKRRAQPAKGNALGRVMMAYEGAKGRDADTVELKLDEAILKESPKVEFGLNLLKLLAGIAPLLGLLGTVIGMIQTFQAMMIYGTGDPQLMAGGISVALVTTALGLIAAIPLLILHSFASSLARSIQNTLEEQSAGIVARHVEARGVPGNATLT